MPLRVKNIFIPSELFPPSSLSLSLSLFCLLLFEAVEVFASVSLCSLFYSGKGKGKGKVSPEAKRSNGEHKGEHNAVNMKEDKNRSKQKYDPDGNRLVAGCIPVRKREGSDVIEILLVSSRRDDSKYILPKGGWEQDEGLEDAAKRETLEEAGVLGTLKASLFLLFLYSIPTLHMQGPYGPYSFKSKRSGLCKAFMFIMTVEQELTVWDEQKERQRLWVMSILHGHWFVF